MRRANSSDVLVLPQVMLLLLLCFKGPICDWFFNLLCCIRLYRKSSGLLGCYQLCDLFFFYVHDSMCFPLEL